MNFFDMVVGSIERLAEKAVDLSIEFSRFGQIHNAASSFCSRTSITQKMIAIISHSHEHRSVPRETKIGRLEEHQLDSEMGELRNPA
jgi:hypothetical protein